MQHLGSHRLAGQPHPDRFRRAHRFGAATGRAGAPGSTGDELARRTQGPDAIYQRSGAADSPGTGGGRSPPRTRRPNTWTLLKWLDEPSPFYDWRGSKSDKPKVHPDDEHLLTAMTKEFVDGPATRVLRMRGHDADWVPV